MQDLSYAFINASEPMKRCLEQGIFFHPHLLMNHDELRKTVDGREQLERHLSEFEARLKERHPNVEYSLLSRLSMYIDKYDKVYRHHN